MVPSVAQVLNGLARTMLMDLLPQTSHAYAGQSLQLSAALAMMCAQETDRAAARLVEENQALAALFRDAAAVAGEAALRDELLGAKGDAPSLLVSALHEHNRGLRGLLVRLHAHVETLQGEAARRLEQRIWAELAQSVERRHLDMAMA